MQLCKLVLLELFSIMLLSGCSIFNSEENRIDTSLLPMIKNQFTPLIMWSASVGNGIGDFYSNLHPAFANSVVYAADREGKICAFNIDSGKKIWSANLAKKSGWFSRVPALLSGGVTVAGNHIYIGTEKAQIYALNIRDGSVAWQVKVAGEVLSSPIVSNGIVLIHTSNSQLQALNETDGAIKWTANLDIPLLSLRGESAPAVTAFGIAVVGDDNGSISAVLIQHGQMIWQQRISQIIGENEVSHLRDVDTTPVIIDDIVYALAYNGNLVALDLHSGYVIWKLELGSVNDCVVNSNRIYLVDQNNHILAINTKGMILWKQNDLVHRMLTAPILYNGSLVVGDNKGYLHWVDIETGRITIQYKVAKSGFLTKPVLANNKLLIQAKDGTLYAIMH